MQNLPPRPPSPQWRFGKPDDPDVEPFGFMVVILAVIMFAIWRVSSG